jgi:site-specific recombinase XerD
MPSTEKTPKRYPAQTLTKDEVDYIIGQCSSVSFTGIRNRALIKLMYRSGLRVSEALTLVPSSLNRADRSIRVLHGKGNVASTRYWYPSADDALFRWMDRRSSFRPRTLPGIPLFCTVNGGYLSDRYVRSMVARLGREAGVDKRVHPHIFRHTFAAELETAGMPITMISKLLGHKRIATTAVYLDHITNRQAGIALASIDLD